MHMETPRGWRARATQHLKDWVIDADDHLDGAFNRFNQRFGRHRPRHVAAYRSVAGEHGVELFGRLLAEAPLGGPKDDDGWWDNLLNTYRRFESDEVPGVPIHARFRDGAAETVTDHEGYYRIALQTTAPPSDALWDNATVSLADGTLLTPQPVLQVGPGAQYGVISDIDDTILHSSILDWKTAAQLTFLHNARTRKPLKGVAKLYQSLQAGTAHTPRNPIFYVSSSPWNLYDLLEDFMELNGIPAGPIHLRDLGTDAGKFLKTEGHGHKLDRARELINAFPGLRWVLLGDSGQHDAELYARAAQEFGDRILAIYIRDVDPDVDSDRDRYVDAEIERIAGTRVPMLRSADSVAMARHAADLGLVPHATVAAVEGEAVRDAQRPTLGEAAADAAREQAGDAVTGP